MSVQTEARAAERRANLLAGLNDAPSALTGWDPVDRPAVRLRDGRLIERRRWQKVDALWHSWKACQYAERVRTDQATRYHALTGRTLPDPHLRRVPKADLTAAVAKADAAARSAESPMTALDAMENLQDALREAARPVLATVNAIMDTLSGVAFPRLPLADPTQDDVVKGA